MLLNKWMPGFYLAPESGTGGGAGASGGESTGGTNQGTQQTQGQGQGQPGPVDSWDQVLAGLPETHRALYEEHTSGLRNALRSERDQRGDLERQLREAAGRLAEGSAERQTLEQLSADLETANARADFFADAVRPEIGCDNPQLAWIAAREIGAFDRKGNVNWDALRDKFPQLFKKSAPPGNAGAGTGGGAPATGETMDDIIRRKAGVRL